MGIRQCPLCRMPPKLQERRGAAGPEYRYICRGCLDRAEGWSPTVAQAAAAWNAGITAGYAREAGR